MLSKPHGSYNQINSTSSNYPREEIPLGRSAVQKKHIKLNNRDDPCSFNLTFYLQRLVWVAVRMALTLRGSASVTPCASITRAAAPTMRSPVA